MRPLEYFGADGGNIFLGKSNSCETNFSNLRLGPSANAAPPESIQINFHMTTKKLSPEPFDLPRCATLDEFLQYHMKSV